MGFFSSILSLFSYKKSGFYKKPRFFYTNLLKAKKIALAIYLLIYNASYIIIIQYYIMGKNKRTSYLEVFYELNENVLKILISNCENLFKKLKMSELKEEEDEVIDENIDKRVYYLFKEKQNRRNSLFAIRKSEPIVNHSKMQNWNEGIQMPRCKDSTVQQPELRNRSVR